MKNFSPRSAAHGESVHAGFAPRDVRSGEGIRCRLQLDASDEVHDFAVWRLSPFGVELVDEGRVTLTVGAKAKLTLTVAGQQMLYKGSVVMTNLEEGKKRLAGVRLDSTPKPERKGADVDQRGDTRWQCHRLFFPTGMASSRTRFNDKFMFRVMDISAGGLRIVLSVKNRFVNVGNQFEATISAPSAGECQVRLKVIRVGVKEEDDGTHQLLGVKMVSPSRKTLATLGQYILQFGGDDKVHPSPRALAQQGFYVQSVNDVLEYDNVRSDEDYQQVLALRALALRGEKEVHFTGTAEDTADIYDARSRILVCRFRGQIVATARLCFHGPDEKFEEEAYVAFPKDFPPRHLVVEASRVATHPDFRGGDLFLNILRYILLVTLQSGRRYIVQTTYQKLIPVYEKLGFRQLGVHGRNPAFPDVEVHMMLLGDIQHMFEGRGSSMLLWNAYVPDILHLLENNGNLQLNWLEKKRLAFYQALLPLYRFYERRKIEKRMDKQYLRRLK